MEPDRRWSVDARKDGTVMTLLLVGMGLLVGSGLLALTQGGNPRLASRIAAGGVTAGAICGLVSVVQVFTGGPVQILRLNWSLIPGASLYLYLDGLAGLFLAPILILSALSSIYGVGYLAGAKEPSRVGVSWFFFNLLVVSMMTVVLARNALLFLVAWEVMALAGFFLVAQDTDREEVRQAGRTYLVATHLGTALLLVFFLLIGGAGTLDFDSFAAVAHQGEAFRSLLFLLALIGFGTKVGLIPVHVWLPETYQAAPGHVAVLIAGVMGKTGIYGILRVIGFLGHPLDWWGWLLIGVGALSGILGILFALAQHDLKRMLAYSSIENMGILALGMGLGVLGMNTGNTTLTVLGFGGTMLHVVNHAMFKGLLFMGAGAVLHGAQTQRLDQMGGLLKRMPWTGTTFLVGATAIAGLPPLNGFVGEFLLYFVGFGVMAKGASGLAVPAAGAMVALALIGGLAAACFARAFGVAFLGEPRTEAAKEAHEMGWTMRLPMLILAGGCVGLGFLWPMLMEQSLLFVDYPVSAIACVTHCTKEKVYVGLSTGITPLVGVVLASTGLVLLFGLLCRLRQRQWVQARQPEKQTVTWDCGYAAPTTRMQYTASSFAQPIVDLFRACLGTKKEVRPPEGLFPPTASFESETPEVFREYAFAPVFRALQWLVGRLRWLQHGRVQVYVLYITITLLVLLVWKLG